jgi:glycosyltransferase involved in cell wall biosynthesis
MKIEVLIAAMHRIDASIYKEMNLQTDAVIINQCDRFERQELIIDGKKVKLYSFDERGVGKSRNNALMNASADICMLADEDMIYVDGYEEIVLEAFNRFPKADVIIFQVNSLNPKRPSSPIKKNGRARAYEVTRFGACRIAFKREKIQKANIWFSLMFGGGALYGSGEDSIFIQDLFKNGLYVYTCKEKIADIKQDDSTWFTGYNDKYFKDKGALYAAISKRHARLITVFSAFKMFLRLRKSYSFFRILSLMNQGINEYL